MQKLLDKIPNEYRTPLFVITILLAVNAVCGPVLGPFLGIFSMFWLAASGYFLLTAGTFIDYTRLNSDKSLWDIHLTELGNENSSSDGL